MTFCFLKRIVQVRSPLFILPKPHNEAEQPGNRPAPIRRVNSPDRKPIAKPLIFLKKRIHRSANGPFGK